MNILEGVKPSSSHKNTNPTKFIIKSKPSAKENKVTIEEGQIYANNSDVYQFINYMLNKSVHFLDFLKSKAIEDPKQFADKHLYENPSIRTLLKSILDKMLVERRLGKNLKGMNKGILQEIQSDIWSSLERQITLYQLNNIYEEEKNSLMDQLSLRRKQIEEEMLKLSGKNIQNELLAEITEN